MVHCFLASPFDDAARAEQFAAVRAILQAHVAECLLLGNLVLEDGAAPIDALLVRPHSLTLLVLVPRGGRLSIPALGYGAWQLGGAPLTGVDDFDNPFEQFTQQKQEVEQWLRPRFTLEQANLRHITGVVLFAAPIDFAPDVELALNGPSATGFHLLDAPTHLPRHLPQLDTPEIDLSSEELAMWAAEWAALREGSPELAKPDVRPVAAPTPEAPAGTLAFLSRKARAVWGWLGAADVPDDDPPYGVDTAAVAARSEEKRHLERLRQEMQADLTSQLQAMEAREAERERSIARLRAELAVAPPVAAEATALVSRLSAETREKAALEAAMLDSAAESAARNQELDAKIQQLSQLIERLSNTPGVPAPGDGAHSDMPASGPSAVGEGPRLGRSTATELWEKLHAVAGPRYRQLRAWRRRLPRVTMVAGGFALAAAGLWGLSHLGGKPPVPYQENGRWGFADAKGQPVIPAQFTAASSFEAGRAVVAKDGAYGFVNEDGKEVVPAAYDALNAYAGGFARARVGDAYTFVDEKGEEFDTYYYNALDFAEGYAAALDHRGWHYISGPTEPSNPALFIEAYSFVGGLARVKLPDGYTYITPDYLENPSPGTKPFGRYSQASELLRR